MYPGKTQFFSREQSGKGKLWEVIFPGWNSLSEVSNNITFMFMKEILPTQS